MALSEQEQRALEEIERALTAEDPRLAKRASQGAGGTGFALNIQSVAIMLLGLCVLVGGVSLAQHSLWFVALSVLGFFIMFGGGLMAFKGGSAGSGRGKAKPSAKRGGPAGPASSTKGGKPGGVSDRMEESFRKRFEK
ncbi:DUF3040 domain-containing protein [Corynebacterium suicordis]|uniref:DUF3040 domain-containing protein n=1 Tax=Corynebacterium suicordis DSM 45110 TaxID=1121369 RepID=A0ABR9ZK91_9CORY|nr:DUF3040 domain-containing protein [Corynebacterium suicordis]MBF4553815.1 DUF3040 domain-containing protein [Corynebacterium suicordis DSM 45110]MDR6277208.1 hypothetical protein [Corynebacterium suicordis]